MNLRSNSIPAWFWALVLGVFIGSVDAATAGEAKFEAQLVWATNDDKSPGDEYQPADEETHKKFDSLGLKWKYYYVLKNKKKNFETKNGESGKVEISEKSAISVKLVDDKQVEVVFYGKKGEECSRRKQPLKSGEILCFGGDVPENASAWLVALKRIK